MDGTAPEPDAGDATDTVPYDHLVLAVGSGTNYFGTEGVRAFAFDFKTLGGAMALRNHVIACFERADRIDESAEQRALLTFVVAGAGVAGAELAGALNDPVHELLVNYPNVSAEAVRVVVVHSGDRITVGRLISSPSLHSNRLRTLRTHPGKVYSLTIICIAYV